MSTIPAFLCFHEVRRSHLNHVSRLNLFLWFCLHLFEEVLALYIQKRNGKLVCWDEVRLWCFDLYILILYVVAVIFSCKKFIAESLSNISIFYP